MKRICIALVAVAAIAGTVGRAHAFGEFKKEFDKMYLKESPATDAEKSLKEAAEKAKCAICHVDPEKDKKHRNAYGKAVEKFIAEVVGKPEPDKDDIKALKKDSPKIIQLLEKAAKEHSDPDKADSPTFGDLIKEGKLPAGN